MIQDDVQVTAPRWIRRTAVAGVTASAAAMVLVSPAQAGAAVPGTPGLPSVTRVSAGPYDGFQFCGGGQKPVVNTGWAPTFAASTTRSVGDPSYPRPIYPDTQGRFEIARPGDEGKPLIRETSRVDAGGQLILQKPVPAGTYRWRVRAENHALVSPWTAWCDFVVSVPTS